MGFSILKILCMSPIEGPPGILSFQALGDLWKGYFGGCCRYQTSMSHLEIFARSSVLCIYFHLWHWEFWGAFFDTGFPEEVLHLLKLFHFQMSVYYVALTEPFCAQSV